MTQDRKVDKSRRDFLLKTAALGTGLVFSSQSEKPGLASLRPFNASPSADKMTPLSESIQVATSISPAQIQKAVSASIANIVAEGLDDVFIRPFEVDMLDHSLDLRTALRDYVSDMLHPLKFNAALFKPIETILMPKRRLLKFRKCARIDPVDATAYLALVLLAADQIESQRPARDANIVFSYRFNPDSDHLFSRRHTYRSFVKHTNRRLRQYQSKILVECDIQGFYDNINLKHLNRRLKECSVDKMVADYIQDLLMYWSDDSGYGLPVGSNASRVLAESMLIPIDNYLMARGIEFVRYVDDFRIFAPDTRTANEYLTNLLEVLSLHGYNANPTKTRIIDVNDLLAVQGPTRWAQNISDAPSTGEQRQRSPGSGRGSQEAIDSSPEADALEEEYSETLPNEAPPIDENESGRLQNLDLGVLSKMIEGTNMPNVKIMKDFISASVLRGSSRYVMRIPQILVRVPQLTGFSVSTLIQNRQRLTPDLQRSVSARMAKFLSGAKQPPTYAVVQILRLLGSPGFQHPKALKTYFHGMGRDFDTFRARATLDALTACRVILDSSMVQMYYAAADPWGKRSLLNLIRKPRGAVRYHVLRQAAAADGRKDPFIAELA